MRTIEQWRRLMTSQSAYANERHFIAIMICNQRASGNGEQHMVLLIRLRAISGLTMCALGLMSCASSQSSQTAQATDPLAGNAVAAQADNSEPGSQADKLLRLAADIEARGSLATALPLYERAANSGSGQALPHIKLGDAYMRLGRPADAAPAYRTALSYETENGFALLGLGSAFIQLGQLTEGRDKLAEAADRLKTATAYDRLGVANIFLGNPDEALASFEQAHALDGNDLDVISNLALAAVLLKQNEKAVSLMYRISGSAKAQNHHWHNLVLVLGIADKAEEAKKLVAQNLNSAEVETTLKKAQKISSIEDTKKRAQALGTVQGEVVSQ